jgi:hypothetical protein
MTFEEAPEKIWAGNDGYANRWGWDTPNDWPEYTRSDIAEAEVARLEQVVAALTYLNVIQNKLIDSLYIDLAGESI